MNHRYCYHITDGVTRSALISGTVTAGSMEEAAEFAAARAKLTKLVETDSEGRKTCRWVKDGKRRSVYVLHDPFSPNVQSGQANSGTASDSICKTTNQKTVSL